MFKKLKLALLFNSFYNQLKEVTSMKYTSNVQMILQVMTISAAFIANISGFLPAKYSLWSIAIAGGIQAFLGKLGTTRNSDGTPQETKFIAKPEGLTAR